MSTLCKKPGAIEHTDDNYTDLIGKIVTYREDESGDYALRAAPNSYQNAASFTRNFDSDGKSNDASGILKGASWGFDLKNSNASITVGAGSWEDGVQIQIDSDNDGAKDDPLTTVYANSETVFVVARTDSSAPYNTTYTAYVGVRNVPNIDGTRANVEATYYVRGNNIVAFMFIDAGRATVTGGSNDVVFLAGAEGMKGHVYSNDGSDYYLYNAVVSGKVTQVKVDANLTVGSFDGGDETNFLIQSPVTNNKGIITSATAASSISATGIWKLSGEYTIGLGGNRASESVRYTVASNADMFYVDTDGVITEIAEVSDIVSDTDAKVLAVMGADGDIEHLFIQEVDTNDKDNASGVRSYVASFGSWTSPNLTLNLGGTVEAGDTFTVTVEQLMANGYVTITTSADASIGTNGVLSGGATNFDMKNTRAAIKVNGTDTVYGNSETVFVVAESTAAGKTDYSVYKGIKNAPTIMSDDPTTPATEANAVEMVYTTSGSSDVVTFAFIDATGAYVTNGKRDVVFLAAESATKMITDGDNNQYYLYNAVVDDEITTVKVKAVQDAGSVVLAGNDTTNQVVTNADYNNKGLLTSADAISGSDYTTLTGVGVWKLSGSYSIGLSGTTASASIRYTVASDAKMYYIDTDGVITKVDDVKNISSDSTATYIGLLDVTDGDIAYLFIQEVDNGKQEGAGSSGVVLSGISATYTTGTVSVTLTGTNAGQVYPVTISLVNGGTLVKLTTANVTGAATTTTTTISAALSAGSTYMVTCGDQSFVLGV